MAFGRFSEEEWGLVRNAVNDLARFRQRADRVIEGVRQVFDAPYPKENWGVLFVPSSEGMVSIDTPYGLGRGRLQLMPSARGGEGSLIIEKQVLNDSGQPEWRIVWHLRMSANGVFAGDDEGEPFQLHGFRQEDAYAEIALSILYAIASGVK